MPTFPDDSPPVLPVMEGESPRGGSAVFFQPTLKPRTVSPIYSKEEKKRVDEVTDLINKHFLIIAERKGKTKNQDSLEQLIEKEKILHHALRLLEGKCTYKEFNLIEKNARTLKNNFALSSGFFSSSSETSRLANKAASLILWIQACRHAQQARKGDFKREIIGKCHEDLLCLPLTK